MATGPLRSVIEVAFRESVEPSDFPPSSSTTPRPARYSGTAPEARSTGATGSAGIGTGVVVVVTGAGCVVVGTAAAAIGTGVVVVVTGAGCVVVGTAAAPTVSFTTFEVELRNPVPDATKAAVIEC